MSAKRIAGLTEAQAREWAADLITRHAVREVAVTSDGSDYYVLIIDTFSGEET